jgi:CO dehydrogenase maturation factor
MEDAEGRRTMNASILAGKKIGLFGKGGSGKSTVTVLLARTLADRGYEPVVLDADSTNVGLAQALGLERTPALLMEHLGGLVFSGGTLTCPVDDPTPLPQPELDLKELPGEYLGETESGIRLLLGGKMGDLGPGAGCDGPIAKIARDLRVREDGGEPPLLVDFKAGFEDSARGVLTGLDLAVVVVDPTTAAVGMAVHLKQMVERIRSGEPPATAHFESPEMAQVAQDVFRGAKVKGVVAVLNRVPDEETEAHLRKRLEEEDGPEVVGVIPEDRALQSRWLKGEMVRLEERQEALRDLVVNLEESPFLRSH